MNSDFQLIMLQERVVDMARLAEQRRKGRAAQRTMRLGIRSALPPAGSRLRSGRKVLAIRR